MTTLTLSSRRWSRICLVLALTLGLSVAVTLPATPASAASSVTTFAELQAAVTAAAPAGGTVVLGANITAGAGERLDVPIGQPVVLDLAGFTLTIGDPIQTNAAIHLIINSTLEVTDSVGTGILVAGTREDGWGAGIGGDLAENGGVLIVQSGTVMATSYLGAGIGGGYGGESTNGGIGATVTVNGGSVTATGLSGGAGIGGGSGAGGGAGGVVHITGGSVSASANHDEGVVGAGIGGGGGGLGGDGGTLTVSGGVVDVTSGVGTAIGGGNGGAGATVSLYGGELTATSTDQFGAGIGAGPGSTNTGTLTLDGASTGLPAVNGGSGTSAPAAGATPRSPLTSGLEYTATVGTGSFHIQFLWDVTVDTAGGSRVDTIRVPHGQPLTLPADPVRSGYSFAGWAIDKQYTFGEPVVEPLHLVAQWTPLLAATGGPDSTPLVVPALAALGLGGLLLVAARRRALRMPGRR